MAKKVKKTSIRIVTILLLIGGVLIIALSSFYLSSFLTILGANFLLLSFILNFLSPTKKVDLELLLSQITTNANTIHRVLRQYETSQKAIYLPPKNLYNPDTSLIFLPLLPNQPLPKPQDTANFSLKSKEGNAIFLTPPGLALSEMYEKELGIKFIKTDLNYIQEKIPLVLVDNLSIAEKVEVKTCPGRIVFRLSDNIFSQDLHECESQAYNNIGNPLSSSIACVLAKATGKPIIIINEEKNQIDLQIMES